uniref:HAT C-terminal dimerisation domain-containing protein n=1 Tax=Chenopodium quinoa TaxID=63459 RepID=A0A803N575_CHEQI
MAIAMNQKFDKYWGNVNKMNKLIYVASILDPHCKFILVELSLIDMHGKEKGSKLANEGTSGYVMNELDRFLHKLIRPEEEELDASTWWGINGHRYPALKCMAHDILAVPLPTVASESAFSTGGRTLDPFRSSLTPKGSEPGYRIEPVYFIAFILMINHLLWSTVGCAAELANCCFAECVPRCLRLECCRLPCCGAGRLPVALL